MILKQAVLSCQRGSHRDCRIRRCRTSASLTVPGQVRGILSQGLCHLPRSPVLPSFLPLGPGPPDLLVSPPALVAMVLVPSFNVCLDCRLWERWGPIILSPAASSEHLSSDLRKSTPPNTESVGTVLESPHGSVLVQFDLSFVCSSMKEPLHHTKALGGEGDTDMREGQMEPWFLKETGQGTRTKGVVRAEVEGGPGVAFSCSGQTEQPRPGDRKELWPVTTLQRWLWGLAEDRPAEACPYWSLCSFVFPVGILVHFSGSVAFFSLRQLSLV